ncbi:hypothetical protein CY0110_00960 [Crocosphaera chwakensis CCY0110]|uniref:Uncharacterized protein n=1 Tax=Crocosphaera chwakensis CCY0110 TaxID=391612 RepID=A3IZV1_9CHRO|nr:hypothetical protein CY0110_00960 [Crocosphaera chwakensis CCY0110]
MGDSPPNPLTGGHPQTPVGADGKGKSLFD